MGKTILKTSLLLTCVLQMSCNSTKEFWRYVVDKEVSKPLAEREKGTVDTPRMLSPHNVKVVYNDGSTSTEVVIPVLSSGQQILIAHNNKTSPSALSVVPLPPGDADRALEDAYLESGKQVVRKEPPVSIVKTHARIQELVKEGNYSLALEFADQLLKRYPNHVKTLRTKGSLLLKIGEKAEAIKAYQKAQDIEPDARVEELIRKLESEIGG